MHYFNENARRNKPRVEFRIMAFGSFDIRLLWKRVGEHFPKIKYTFNSLVYTCGNFKKYS